MSEWEQNVLKAYAAALEGKRVVVCSGAGSVEMHPPDTQKKVDLVVCHLDEV